jgi:hypothetical protein
MVNSSADPYRWLDHQRRKPLFFTVKKINLTIKNIRYRLCPTVSQLLRRAGVRCTHLFRPGVAADSGVYHAEANSGCIWGSSCRDLFVDGSNCAKRGDEVFIGKELDSFESDSIVA